MPSFLDVISFFIGGSGVYCLLNGILLGVFVSLFTFTILQTIKISEENTLLEGL